MEVALLLTIGIFSKSFTLVSNEFTEVTYMVLSIRMLPDGEMALFLAMASTT